MTHHNHKQQKSETQSPQKTPTDTDVDIGGSLPQAIDHQKTPIDPRTLTPASLLQLQRTIGNQAVIQLLRQQKSTSPKNGTIQRDWLNTLGDALNLRENESALDLWEDYEKARIDKFDFMTKLHKAENFQSTTNLGMFDATYNPLTNTIKIVCKCKFNFFNAPASEYPKAKKEDLKWEKKDQTDWKNTFLSKCSSTWSSAKQTFYAQKDWWEDLSAKVVVEFVETKGKPHFNLKIKKIPKNAFSVSSVARPKVNKKGYTPGTGNFDSEDLKEVNKPGGKQIGAVHEAGHMLGLDDEYVYKDKKGKPLKKQPTPSHSKLVQSEFGHGVAKADDGRIMAGGSDIKPEHGVTFLAALKKATGMDDWSTKKKKATPVPENPNQPGKGDYPLPSGDTKFA